MASCLADRCALPALLALTMAVYVNALGVTFLLDDIGDILGNPSAAATTFFDRLPFTNRPLTKASYAINDLVHGAHAAGYAAVNVTLHLAAIALSFCLGRRAFGRIAAPSAASLALATCAIWAVHPALTESVTYLSGRSMVFSAALMLGALIAATADRSRIGVAFACAMLAPLARETALILPLMLLWWRFTIGGPVVQWPVWLGTALAATLILALPRYRDLIAFSLDMRDPLLALRGNIHAATDTLSFWVMPWRVTIFPEAPPPYGWLETPTLVRLAGFFAVTTLAIAMRRRMPVASFCIGLALLALAPSQSFIWRTDPVALKPLYLAGLGLSLAAVDLIRHMLAARSIVIAALVIALPLGIMTSRRNALFGDVIALSADAASKTPDNPDALIAYGSALIAEERYDEAYAVLDRALDRAPHDERAINLLELIATIRSVAPAADAP